MQFVLNSLVGIGIGAFFAWRSARGGGDANEQALAYFLPGILYNGGYAALMALSNLVGWPVVGFMVGSVEGDPTAWHSDPQVVRLCRNLTWMLAAPCLMRVARAAAGLARGRSAHDPTAMIAALGVSKVAMGWPLQILGLAGMVWLLARNRDAGRDAGRGRAGLSGYWPIAGGEQVLELASPSLRLTNSSSSPCSIGCSAAGCRPVRRAGSSPARCSPATGSGPPACRRTASPAAA